jgi:hypothetical protein
MAFRLRHDLHWCVSGGRVIFLDVDRDLYSCLPLEAGAAFIRLAGGHLEPGDLDRLGFLVARGMLIEDPLAPATLPALRIPAAAGDWVEDPAARASAADTLRDAASQMRWAALLRVKPLRAIASSVGRRARIPRARPGDAELRVRRIVSASAAAALLLGSHDRCLIRALALHSACCRQGIRSRLVFGVRSGPFRAHCWVQLEDRVLVGDFEQVRLFTPIMALG